jgi:hypothetical protein
MSRSSLLRLGDFRQIVALLGECRDLGVNDWNDNEKTATNDVG